MARYNWDTQEMEPASEAKLIDPDDPEWVFASVLARLEHNQPTHGTGLDVERAETDWDLAGLTPPGDDWVDLEAALDSVPRQPLCCPCCPPLGEI